METHNQKFLDEMKVFLLEEKAKLENELSRFAIETDHQEGRFETQFNDLGRDQEDNAHEVEEYESNLALENTLEVHLQEIIEALERINAGNYGISQKSGKIIPEERLRIYPEAKTCADE
ncbi:MAG: hypothetical protein IPN70_02445 [Candidatus Moraniibacteriota bacterium]|nr:MAG: hypothetical protein IPN70_02445 [Candidatus Moranbacteria bacterium]